MNATTLTVHLDPTLYQKAQIQAQIGSRTLEQVVARLLREWVESQSAQYARYVVRSGDTLARIAANFYGDARQYVVIAQFNGITDPRLLRVGQVLLIPPLGGPPPQPPLQPVVGVPLPELDIEFIQSPHHDERPPGTKIWAIVVHATANSSLAGLISWFKDPQSRLSAHYNIGKDGRIVQMVRDERRAWHAGRSIWKGVQDVNDFALGIELVNRNDGLDPYPEAQYQALVALCQMLIARYDIQVEDIMGHKDISLSGKSDPAGFDLDRLRRDIVAQ